MARPVVGITTYVTDAKWGYWNLEAALIPFDYVKAVERAGGRALLVPPSLDGVEETLDALDGVIFTGGSDVDPELYGAEAQAETVGVVRLRDDAELALLRAALDRDMPVLGICRGIQVLNVGMGGDIDQHFDGHRHDPPGQFVQHDVAIEPNTRLAKMLGERTTVMSHHHQGLHTLAPGLVETARADDGDPGGGRGARSAIHRRRPLAPRGGRGRAALRDARRRGRALPPGTRMTAVLNPATEETIAEVEAHSAEQTDEVIARAKAAFPAWRAVAPADRARLLRRLATLVEEHHEELSRIESRNAGKPIAGARGEIGMVAQVFHFYAGAVDKHYGETIPVAGGVDMTFREPLGVVGLIVPWNFPLNISSWKLGPALACGNTVVLKPAELTPLSALRLAELALEAGIPEGVLNVVTGKGSVVGQRLIEHPDVAKIGFTGSTEVGQQVMRGAAGTIKRVTLELGGKSANLVFADADLEKAAASAPYAVFDNAGQDCCARSRILVEKTVYDRFAELLVTATRGVRVGDPELDNTEMGPLISAAHRETVASFVEGEPLFRGDVPGGKGYWYPATLVEAKPDDRVAREEVFGPVAALIPFIDEAEAVRIANASVYGLSGSIWTRDGARALRVARALETGVLSINSNSSVRVSTPFGGFKQSGFGRELGMEAMAGYSEVKNVFYSTE